MSRFPSGLKSILVMVMFLLTLNIAMGTPRGGSSSSSRSSSGSSSRSSSGSSYKPSYRSSSQSSPGYSSRSIWSLFGSSSGNGGRHSDSPPSYSSSSKTYSLPSFHWERLSPKGPPPAYSAHDTVSGARTNIRETPPAYEPQKKASSSLYHSHPYYRTTTSSYSYYHNKDQRYNATEDYLLGAATNSHNPLNGYIVLITTFLYLLL
ncbi:RNA-binding protein with serine-rich domain 1-B [Drosophila yakuba]|uniref:Uncharacterized protein n=1 Tax=Drosophila yakuba TaxID=7245 RepID=B4P1H6_DROYA|nr:RNA-binding protein with serine-rich domain 1-B [Drosophila yakuba]EDW88083.1 uncharacterized protein Dyak_GE12818 [Drosophila yakuba]